MGPRWIAGGGSSERRQSMLSQRGLTLPWELLRRSSVVRRALRHRSTDAGSRLTCYCCSRGFDLRQARNGRPRAGRANRQISYTDDDHRFIESSFKLILKRAFPISPEDKDTDERFQALLDALGRVSNQDG